MGCVVVSHKREDLRDVLLIYEPLVVIVFILTLRWELLEQKLRGRFEFFLRIGQSPLTGVGAKSNATSAKRLCVKNQLPHHVLGNSIIFNPIAYSRPLVAASDFARKRSLALLGLLPGPVEMRYLALHCARPSFRIYGGLSLVSLSILSLVHVPSYTQTI